MLIYRKFAANLCSKAKNINQKFFK